MPLLRIPVTVWLFCIITSRLIIIQASPVGSVIRNFARGSALKCTADLCGGLPVEVWKSSVVLENIRANHALEKPASSLEVLSRILNERGIQGLWSGCSARMVEGFFSGAVLPIPCYFHDLSCSIGRPGKRASL